MVYVLAFTGMAQADITVSEGQSFTGKVVDIGSCNLTSATIYWGDGTPTSPGTSDGGTGIQGSHTYTEERSSPAAANVTYTCSNGGTQPPIDFQATVQDAPLTAAGRDTSGTSGNSVTGVVAHFSDANPGATAGDFSALIMWGDGLSNYGTVTASPGGGFDVSGAHTYETAGSFSVSTSIGDAGGSSANASSAAQIASPPPPPPPASGAPPTARFRFGPVSPCRDQFVTFDASDSSPGGNPIRQYRWSFANVTKSGPNQTVDAVHSAFSTYFGEWTGRSAGDPPSNGDLSSDQGILDLYRPAVGVTLTVIDSAGRSASTSQTITFADPHESLNIAFGGGLFDYYGQNAAWRVISDPTPCDKILDNESALPFGGGEAILHNPSATLLGNQKAVGIAIQCSSPRTACYGALALLRPAQSKVRRFATRVGAQRARTTSQALGFATFAAPAQGRAAGRTTVTVKLNARGQRLARAHKLPKLVLRLGVFRPKGKLRVTTRTVTLRQHH